MLSEWLEPSIKKRIIDVSDICCENEEIIKFHNKSAEIFDKLKTIIPRESQYMLDELESAHNLNSGLIMEISYRIGFDDGIKILEIIHR